MTLSRGQPAAQPQACVRIVATLKGADIHATVYSGFIYEDIVRAGDLSIDKVLAFTDVLVRGPFTIALRDDSLARRGSSNQRVIDLAKVRQIESLSLLDWD